MAIGCLESSSYLGSGIKESWEEEGEDRIFRLMILGVESRPHLLTPLSLPPCLSSRILLFSKRSQEGKVEMTVELVKAISQVSYFHSHP